MYVVIIVLLAGAGYVIESVIGAAVGAAIGLIVCMALSGSYRKKTKTIIFEPSKFWDQPLKLQVMSKKELLLAAPANFHKDKDGYRFIGWSNEMNASNPEIKPGEIFTVIERKATLYAVQAKIHKMDFDGNGNTGGTVPEPLHGIAGEGLNIPAPVPTKNGFSFVGWNTCPNATGTAYLPGATAPIGNSDVILYAIWSEFGFSEGVICGFKGNNANIVIPSAINATPVTSIGDKAFRGCLLDSLVIPDSVTGIGDAAFLGSTLVSITILGRIDDMSPNAMGQHGESFLVAYNKNGKKAGRYAFGGEDWSFQS